MAQMIDNSLRFRKSAWNVTTNVRWNVGARDPTVSSDLEDVISVKL